MIAKLTKSEARTLKRLINKVVGIEVHLVHSIYDQQGSDPTPEYKRRKRALKEFIEKRTEK